MYYHVLQPKIFTKPGWAKPACVVTSSNIAVQANVAVGEQCGNTQLLNVIKLLPCYIVTILCRTNVEKVTHYCIVFYGNMRGPHCGIAPLLRSIGELHTGCKWAVIALNPLMSQVEGTFVKDREEALHTSCGENCPPTQLPKAEERTSMPTGEKNCPHRIRTRKTLRFDIAAMPALAHQADTGPKRVQSPFGRKTVSKTNRTKVLDTTELISTRHDYLFFAPGYSKGLSLNSLTPKCVPAGRKNSRSEGFWLAKHKFIS
jgi:hypothetical protein